MGRRKSLEKKGVDEIFDRGMIRIVTAKERAMKQYGLGYVLSNPRKAGWLLYMLDYLDQHRSEILSKQGKARADYVMDLVHEASQKWKAMTQDQKEQWIQKATSELGDLSARLKSMVTLSQNIEKAVEEATRQIEVIASAI